MDEKKVREVIEDFRLEMQTYENMISYCEQFEPKTDCRSYKEIVAMHKTAIEALKKQLPEKVKQRGVTTQDGIFHRINGINGVPYDLCPNCEVNLCTDGILGRNKKDMKYCERCGQRLDWSEE